MLYHDGNSWVLSNTGSMIVGDLSGQNTSTGNAVGFGPLALANLVDSSFGNHTAVGLQAMEQATGTVFSSDAFGYQSLRRLTDGSGNSGFGDRTLSSLREGSFNAAFGSQALATVSSGLANTGLGRFALHALSQGGYNTAVGAVAGWQLSAGTGNTLIGYAAGASNIFNPPVSDTVVIGKSARADYTGAIVIGADASATGPYSVTIGDALLESAVVSTGPAPVPNRGIRIKIGTRDYLIPAQIL